MTKRLSQREKWIIGGGLLILGIVFVWFALLSPYLSTMSKLDRRVAAMERNLIDSSQMAEEIELLRTQLAAAGKRKQGRRPLFSKVEGLTEQTGVREQLLSMRPQPATVQGDFRQQLVEIRLEKISLAQLVRLLHAIEYRSGGVQVKSMRVKPRFEDRAALDVNMVLMSLEKP